MCTPVHRERAVIFGDESQNDPEFISLKDKIYTAISDNRSLNSDFDRPISLICAEIDR